jgi:hypothetical protein
MAGDDTGGEYDPYSPRKPKSSRKGPDLRVVAGALDDARPQEASSAAGARAAQRDRDAHGRTAGPDAIAAGIADTEAEARSHALESDPPPGRPIAGIDPGRWTPDEWGLPPGCPVLPLGTEDGLFFFLDTIGQMRALKESELGQAGINALFMGRHLWLYWAFPKTNRDGQVTSWRPEKARETLMGACARKGAWNPFNRVRGRGMWKGRDGRLVLHCGDRLVSQHGEEALGELEGMVYPTRPALPPPWPLPLSGKPGPAVELLGHFETWQWVRPKLDPILLIGWIGVGFLGGALGCRPGSYITGDKATGKSGLHNDIKQLFGEWLINTGDTTAAGLYQLLKFDCLPVAIDEFEAKADNRKAKAVVELMRLSFTGAPMNRGGDSHKGTQFHGRSAFNFSSINMPAMEPQDLSRLAILRLRRLAEGSVKPVIPEERWRELGRQVLRRLMDNWSRWHETFTAWREFLAGCGHDGRGQDTFGTLMAVADLVIADDAIALDLAMGPNATDGEAPFDAWRPHLAAASLAEFEDAAENWSLCLGHLMSQRIEAWRGGTRHTVGEVLADFFEADINTQRLPDGRDGLSFGQARALLEQTGLTLIRPSPKTSAHYELHVPNQHPLLNTVFRESKWQGELAAGTWTGALRQAPAEIWREASARINGRKFKGTAFPLKEIIVGEAEATG